MMQQQLPRFPESHNPAAMASSDMTVPEWQTTRLRWLQQEQQRQSFFTAATPTSLIDLRRPNGAYSVLPADHTAAEFDACNDVLCDEAASSVAHELLIISMLPGLIHRPVFGAGEGCVVDGAGDEATPPDVAASPFDVRAGAAVAAAAARCHPKVDTGRVISRKRKAAHEATAEEPEDDDDDGRAVERVLESDGRCYIGPMIVPKLESSSTDHPLISSVDTTAAAADGGSSADGKTTGGTKVSDPAAKTGYIHVRARRGQATDSHSLAERARREKISKRMKLLQELVPGCSRITGKAGVLDEIINYVQSLQRQVEFLSMKLAAVNPILDSDIDAFLTKEMIPLHGGVSHPSVEAPLEEAPFPSHVNTMQTQRAVAAPTAAQYCGGGLISEVAVSSSCPGEEAPPLHPIPRAPPVAVSEACLAVDPYQVEHVLGAATSLWEADLHDQYYRVYE